MRQQRCGESERNRDVTSIKMMPRTAGLTLLRSRADQTKSFSGRLGEYLQCLGGLKRATLLLLLYFFIVWFRPADNWFCCHEVGAPVWEILAGRFVLLPQGCVH